MAKDIKEMDFTELVQQAKLGASDDYVHDVLDEIEERFDAERNLRYKLQQDIGGLIKKR